MCRHSRCFPVLLFALVLPAALAACGGNHASGPPVSAGPDQTVLGRHPVTLLASSNAATQSYHWTLQSKPAASRLGENSLKGADTASLSFTPDMAGAYVFKVTLDTGKGKATDTVKVTSNVAVNAGSARTVVGAAPVTLHASSNAVHPAYRWRFVSRPQGSQAAIEDADSANAHFTPDAPGSYVAQASLVNGKANGTVKITAEHIWQSGVIPRATTPVADATSLALARNGTLYIAYQDENEGGKIVVKRLEGDKWTKLGGAPASTTCARFASLAVSPQGDPVVAFRDFSAQGRGGVTVRRFADGKWTTLGKPGFSAGEAKYIALAIAPNGIPYVAYQAFSNSVPGRLTVKKFDGGQWTAVGRPGFSAGGARYLALVIAADGTPWVAYQDLADIHNGITVEKFDGHQWDLVGNAGLTPMGAIFTSLALAPDGTPYLAYEDGGPEHPATVRKFDGKRWAYVGNAWFTRGEAEFEHLAIARDGTPYLAYQDEGPEGISVRKFDGKHWKYVGRPGFSASEAEGISFLIAGDGTLYVSYRGETQGVAAIADKAGEEDKEGISVKRFDGKRWVQAGGTVDAWGDDEDRSRKH